MKKLNTGIAATLLAAITLLTACNNTGTSSVYSSDPVSSTDSTSNTSATATIDSSSEITSEDTIPTADSDPITSSADSSEDSSESQETIYDGTPVIFSMPLTQKINVGRSKVAVATDVSINVQNDKGEIVFNDTLQNIRNNDNSTSYEYHGTVYVPSWEIGDTYTFNFVDLPPQYTEGITFRSGKGVKDFAIVDTVRNANGNFNASVEVTSFLGSAEMWRPDGKTETVDIKVGVDSPLQFNTNLKHVYRTQYLVLDKNNEIVENAAVWVTTDKSTYKSTPCGSGLNMVFFQSDSEKLEKYEVYYNDNLLYTEMASDTDRIFSSLANKVLILRDIDIASLQN